LQLKVHAGIKIAKVKRRPAQASFAKRKPLREIAEAIILMDDLRRGKK